MVFLSKSDSSSGDDLDSPKLKSRLLCGFKVYTSMRSMRSMRYCHSTVRRFHAIHARGIYFPQPSHGHGHGHGIFILATHPEEI
jgi:hypothetical protein